MRSPAVQRAAPAEGASNLAAVNPPLPEPVVVVASAEDAAAMVEVVHAAFGARPAVDPPSTADAETAETIAEAAAPRRRHLRLGGRPPGRRDPGRQHGERRRDLRPRLRPPRLPAPRHRARDGRRGRGPRRAAGPPPRGPLRARGVRRAHHLLEPPRLRGRPPRPARRGAEQAAAVRAPRSPTPTRPQALGRRLADLVRAGDLLVLSAASSGRARPRSPRASAQALGVTGAVISPTFVLSRVHATADGRPTLVHVDAYRLGSPAELDDLDLDPSAPDERHRRRVGPRARRAGWDDRLEVDLVHDPEGGRVALLRPVGERWVRRRPRRRSTGSAYAEVARG